MPLITIQHIAMDSWNPIDPESATPRGILPAAALALEPDTPAYEGRLGVILANIADTLEENGILIATATSLSDRRAARALARYYSAEMVLSTAVTGSIADLEGNRISKSARDLQQWQQMLDRALDDLEDLLPETQPRGGVYFAPLSEKDDPESIYRARYASATEGD